MITWTRQYQRTNAFLFKTCTCLLPILSKQRITKQHIIPLFCNWWKWASNCQINMLEMFFHALLPKMVVKQKFVRPLAMPRNIQIFGTENWRYRSTFRNIPHIYRVFLLLFSNKSAVVCHLGFSVVTHIPLWYNLYFFFCITLDTMVPLKFWVFLSF